VVATGVVAGSLVSCSPDQPGASTSPSPTTSSASTASSTPSSSPTPSPTKVGVAAPSVVFEREVLDGGRFLMAYDLGTGKVRTLAPIGRDDQPTVNRAGTGVVVVTHTGRVTNPNTPWLQSGTGSHLVLISLVDGSRRPLTQTVKGGFDSSPTWNRAGDGWIYFLRSGRLMRVRAGTGQVEPVPHGDGVSQYVLEPGGKTAWVSARWCGSPQCRLNLVTGAAEPHSFQAAVGGDVAWSPDGAWLAYAPNMCGVPSCPSLYVQRWPDGRRRTILNAPQTDGVPKKWALFGVVGWQPDDERVVLQTTRLAWTARPGSKVKLLGQRILLVDRTDGRSRPIGPRSVWDRTFDVWSPPVESSTG
jgi:hypothetical protein